MAPSRCRPVASVTTASVGARPRPLADRLRRLAGGAVRYGVLLVIAAVIVVPLAYAVLGGFRDNGQIGNSALGWPDPWVPTNYTEVLGSASFWRQVGNSVLIAAISTFVVVAL